jgi:hypothetical protein
MKKTVKIRLCIILIIAVISGDNLCLAALIVVFMGSLARAAVIGDRSRLNSVGGMLLLDFPDGFSVQYADPSSCRLMSAKTPGESGVSGDRIMEGAW